MLASCSWLPRRSAQHPGLSPAMQVGLTRLGPRVFKRLCKAYCATSSSETKEAFPAECRTILGLLAARGVFHHTLRFWWFGRVGLSQNSILQGPSRIRTLDSLRDVA